MRQICRVVTLLEPSQVSTLHNIQVVAFQGFWLHVSVISVYFIIDGLY